MSRSAKLWRRIWIKLSTSLPIFTSCPCSSAISVSTRLAWEMSVIRRLSRSTSCRITFINFCCCAGSEIRLMVSAALRKDESGFFNSCATSAANPAVACIRFCNSSVRFIKDSDNCPISSLRSGKRCKRAERLLLRRRFSAALASWVIGVVIERAR